MGQCTSADGDLDFAKSGFKPKIRDFPNYDFYKGDYPITIHQSVSFHVKYWTGSQQQHQIMKFYQDLESDKQYMQWLYPNFFQSFLNPNSFRLRPEERNKLISDEIVMKQYRINVEMFLRFLGISRNEEKKLEICDDRQLEQCLYNYTHNQKRIQRLLSSMSVLGMREDALELLIVLLQKLGKNHKIYIEKFSIYETVKEEGGNTQKTFNELKSSYVQEDLINEPWVTVDLLTKKLIAIPSAEVL